MKLTLRLADHDSEVGQSRTLETGRLTIGRGPENDWVLADPDRTLSKNHCRIDASESGFMLTDLSTNGVFLSGASSPIGRGQSCALEHGDGIALGPYRMQVEIAGMEGLPAGGLGLPQSEVDAIFLGGPAFGNGGRPPPIAPTIPEGWAAEMPSGGFGPERRAAREGWDAPPDPATYAATGLFEQPSAQGPRTLPEHPFAASPSLFATQSEHIPAASTVMRVPEPQVVLPTDWNDVDPMDSMSARPAQSPAAQPAWPPVLPEAPPPPPSLPADWIRPEPEAPSLPATWETSPAAPAAPVRREMAAVPSAKPAPSPQAARPPATPARPVAPAQRTVPPKPAPAPPPPEATVPAEDGAPPTAEMLLHALLEGAGLPPETVQGADHLATMREIGQMIRAAVEGVRDMMSTRALVKSEFRVDQTVLKRADNNAVKFAPDAQRCLAAMVGAAPPGFLPGPSAMQQAMDDIKSHELALVAALNSVFADLDQQLDPEVIMRRARQETGLSTMLPNAREARSWAIYVETHRLLRESGAANTGGSLLAPLAAAYARQLRRGV